MTLQTVEALLLRLIVVGGAAVGVNDTALPPLVRVGIPLAGALVLCALLAVERWAKVQTASLSVQAAAVNAQIRASNATSAPQSAPQAPGGLVASPSLLQAVGANLEAARAGVVASADAGRHQAPAGAFTLPGPAVVGALSDDYPTEQIGVVPPVPTQPVPSPAPIGV